ncbi:MAG: hypothetical protein B7C54_05720 [Acidimicrobiales bacterium mtb01]|nr:MAG: hypothetical protein B7C54_05720 [Acidimicrobiales bacterium mtb01]
MLDDQGGELSRAQDAVASVPTTPPYGGANKQHRDHLHQGRDQRVRVPTVELGASELWSL